MLTRSQGAAQRRALWKEISRDERQKVRVKLAALRQELRDARARRKRALAEAKERCRAERLAARERARALRARVLQELGEAVRNERAAARDGCSVRLGNARAIKDAILRSHAQLVAEKRFQADMRRIERANRQRRLEAPRITRVERHGESDDEVRQNIPSDLLPLFERVRRGIKATPRMSRTEAFLKYAEEHPGEVLEMVEDKTEALIRDLERQQRELGKRRAPIRVPRATREVAANVPF